MCIELAIGEQIRHPKATPLFQKVQKGRERRGKGGAREEEEKTASFFYFLKEASCSTVVLKFHITTTILFLSISK